MFRKFYPESSEELIEDFVRTAAKQEKNLSPAAVQGHFLFYKTQPLEAIRNLHRL